MARTFTPTHLSSANGQATWPAPDGTQPEGPALPATLPVKVVDTRGGWAQIECSNGWQAWVDAAPLMPVVVEDDDPVAAPRAPLMIGKVQVTVRLVCGVVIFVSAFLNWLESSRSSGFGIKATGMDVPLSIVTKGIDANLGGITSGVPKGGISIGVALLLLGAATVVLSQTKVPVVLTRIIGWVVFLIATGFVFRIQNSFTDTIAAQGFGLIAVGTYVAGATGLVLGLARGGAVRGSS